MASADAIGARLGEEYLQEKREKRKKMRDACSKTEKGVEKTGYRLLSPSKGPGKRLVIYLPAISETQLTTLHLPAQASLVLNGDGIERST